MHALSPQTLLLATDSSALHLYDLRVNANTRSGALPFSSKPQATHYPHDDYISSLTPLPPTDASTSGYSKQWVTTGGTTLAVTDLRRGVLVKSEDQEEELLSSVFVSGFGNKVGRSHGDKVLVGGGSGVLTLWSKGVWNDQIERIIVDGGKESLDALTLVPEEIGEGKLVAVGMGDGKVKIVRMGGNKVVAEVQHDDMEGVLGLGFEVEGRMISGGGQVVKVWQKAVEEEDEVEEVEVNSVGAERGLVSDGEDDDKDADDDSSKEEDQLRNRHKKRKRLKGKIRNGADSMAFRGID